MTLEEMQLAVCEKLPELINIYKGGPAWKHKCIQTLNEGISYYPLHWPTEGLQVCHEAEKLLSVNDQEIFIRSLFKMVACYYTTNYSFDAAFLLAHATHEQRLEALCRVWWPERFNV